MMTGRRPRTITTILMDNGERIDVDSLRGISGKAGSPFGTPQSVRLNILQAYIHKLACEWAFYELGLNPDDAIPMQDALRHINTEDRLARLGKKDARNHQLELAAITAESVIKAATTFRGEGIPEHRIATKVADHLKISATTARTILRKSAKTKVR